MEDGSVWCKQCYDNRERKKCGKRPTKIKQIDVNTGEVIKIWDNMPLIEKEFNVTRIAIWQCCRGLSKTVKGFKWEYVDND